jgi:ATP-binding cassette subfamily F protein 3
MIYKHHFDKDYLLLEQQKKELETRIAHCLRDGDCAKAQVLCDQLGDIVEQM